MEEMNWLVVVIIVIVVILIIILFANRHENGRGSRSSKPKREESSVVYYQEYSGKSARAPRAPQVSNAPPEFPRMEAMAGRKDIQETEKVKPQISQKVQAAPSRPQPKIEVKQEKPVETVFVRNMAELFSPKEDVEEELGIPQERLDQMVAEYKKTKEYKERKLPINRHFDMDKYTQATQTIRQSSVPQKSHGDKKGKIVSSIYKKYGKHFTSQKAQGVNPEIKATLTTPDQHQQAVRNAQGKSSQARLTTRIV